jgi:hypothetical protein
MELSGSPLPRRDKHLVGEAGAESMSSHEFTIVANLFKFPLDS